MLLAHSLVAAASLTCLRTRASLASLALGAFEKPRGGSAWCVCGVCVCVRGVGEARHSPSSRWLLVSDRMIGCFTCTRRL